MSRRAALYVLLAFCGCAGPVPAPPAAKPSQAARIVTASPVAPAPSAPTSVVPLTSAAPSSGPVAAPSSGPVAAPQAAPRRHFAGGGAGSVSGRYGLVTSSEAQATRAGVKVLEEGGNAVDAAVATAFALAVTHPSAGNIGGGGFMLVRSGEPGAQTFALDFRETAPAALTREAFDKMQRGGAKGGAAAGVPGSVAGLLLALERYGTLPRERILAPAVTLARQGFVLGRRQAELLAAVYPQLKQDRTLALRFGAGARPKPAGSRIQQPELAVSLERIQKSGAPGFYEGPTAEGLAHAPGSLIRASDLRQYRAAPRNVLRFDYRDLVVETMPPPSAGGVALAEMLSMLQTLKAHEAQGAEELHLFLEASRRAQADRRFSVRDPDGLAAPDLERWLGRVTSGPELLSRAPIQRDRSTPSKQLTALFPEAARESEQTTHLSVVDARGMVVSLTTTLSASFGAKVTAPGTGIVLNNTVASFSNTGENQPAPGRRTTSSMAPTLVSSDGQVVLVLGTPGGDTIPSTIAQVLRNVVDHGFPLDQAVAAPRIHQGFVPDRARYESKRPLPPALIKALKAFGHDLIGSHLSMGDSNDILLEGDQAFAVADPRGGGLAAAANAPIP